MEPPGLFRRGRARGAPQPQAALYAERPVTTAAQLLSVITDIGRRFSLASLAGVGGAIRIERPIFPSSPIIIPESCPGLTIRCTSRFPNKPSVPALSHLFEIRAEHVTIRDFFLYGDADGYALDFVRTAAPGDIAAGRSVQNARILHCVAWADRVFVDQTEGKADDVLIDDVWQNEANGSHDASVYLDSDGGEVRSCRLEGGPDAIVVDVNGGSYRIHDNAVRGGNITTNASTGSNTIVGNTGTNGGTTITPHIDDDEGLNT